MENIKKLMGDAYHEGVTIEEINTFLAGKNMVDLKAGGYVAKDKFERVENEKKTLQDEFDTYKEQTKDFETLKTENENFKTEKANADLKSKVVKYGIKESAFKYVKGDIDAKELEFGDDEKVNAENVKKYLENHPEFADKQSTKVVKKVVSTSVEDKVDDKKIDLNAKLHNAFINA